MPPTKTKPFRNQTVAPAENAVNAHPAPRKNARVHCRGLKTVAAELAAATQLRPLVGRRRRYGPDWYQELSDRQMQAADDLRASLSEDMTLGSVQRCRRVLRGLGIAPIVKRDDIRAMQLVSKENAVAFLWFLLETFYRSHEIEVKGDDLTKNPPKTLPHEYSVNERLLLSAIAHLNMVTTLRELHKMYPKSLIFRLHHDHHHHDDASSALNKKSQTNRKARVVVCPCDDDDSPYLQPTPRPISRPASKSFSMPALPPPNFDPYSAYATASTPERDLDADPSSWFARNPCGVQALTKCPHCKMLAQQIEQRRAAILKEMFGGKHLRDMEHYGHLMDGFQAAATCCCLNEEGYSSVPVHPSEFDAADSPEELRRLLAHFQMQYLVRTLLKCLLFETIPKLTNIRVCMRCKKCVRDCDLFENLLAQNAARATIPSTTSSTYVRHVHKYLFGCCSPLLMLRIFNVIAVGRDVMLDVCVHNVWQYELALWSDFVPEACASPVNCSNRLAAAATTTPPLDDCTCVNFGQTFPQRRRRTLGAIQLANDPETLDRELYDMLARLRARDPRFVIAWLPEAHKIPLLREWLAHRRGLVYTRAFRERAAGKDAKRLQRSARLPIEVPQPEHVCRARQMEYQRKDLMDCVSAFLEEGVWRGGVCYI